MRRTAASLLLATSLCAGLLVGCTPAGLPSPSTPASSAAPAASTDAASTDAALDAFRTAIAGHTPADPDALVAAVEAAGFPRDAIERTRELDSLGQPVTFLEIAVLEGDSCIVGQVGDGEPMAIRASPLGGGRCLVGEIVTVD